MNMEFFLTNNKSGYKTTEKWFSKNHSDEYQNILNYCSDIKLNLNFKEKIWFYFNNLTERPKCFTCSDDIPFRDRFDKPYGEFCSLDCINNNKEEMIKRQKETFNEKYGVDFYPEHPDFLKKQKNTKLERYGDEYYNNPDQNRKTKLENHGDENYNNTEKTFATKIERYGDENYCNVDKIIETKTNKYGSVNYYNHKKAKETCLEKYGAEYYTSSTEFQKTETIRYRTKYTQFNIIKSDVGFLIIFCDKCQKEFIIPKDTFWFRVTNNHEMCLTCNPIKQDGVSEYEKNISKFLNSISIVHVPSFKIKRFQIDIHVPSFNFGIEFNGLYWHSTAIKKDIEYHLKKYKFFKERNILIIQIFEDEWINKKRIMKSIIRDRVSCYEYEIESNSCELKQIDNKESISFLIENHIHGETFINYSAALIIDDEIISIMTFTYIRDNIWEVSRFCNKLNTSVVGSEEKLLKFFIKNNNPLKIIYKCDIRLFHSEIYEKLGFKFVSHTNPDYWYVYECMRYDKNYFINDSSTEEKNIGSSFNRIYDCGSNLYELDIINQ